ncbi:hypothetical protein JNK13_11870 [bacterium]|nr:hypothetical protein [bacterium]
MQQLSKAEKDKLYEQHRLEQILETARKTTPESRFKWLEDTLQMAYDLYRQGLVPAPIPKDKYNKKADS